MLKLIPTPIRQYTRLYGRMTRSQYFRWLAVLLAIYVFCAWVDLRFIGPLLGYLPFEEAEEQYLTTAAAVLFVVPWVTSSVRRLHDVDRSGRWMFLAIFPLLIMYFSEDIGFSLYGYLAGGTVSGWFVDLLIDWLPWVIIGLAAISFSPVIYWSVKKGSNEPNRYGVRS